MDGIGNLTLRVRSDAAAHCARRDACMDSHNEIPLNKVDMKIQPENNAQNQPGGAAPCMPIRPAQDRAAHTWRKHTVIVAQASILVAVCSVRPWISSRYCPTCAFTKPRDMVNRPKRIPASYAKFSLL